MDVGALEVLLDTPDVVIAWLVELSVDDCVAVCVDELCPCVDVSAMEVLLDSPDVVEAWSVLLIGPALAVLVG